jgi:hypothetical protein
VIGTPAYESWIDQIAALTRDAADGLPGPQRRLFVGRARLNEALLSDLLTQPDPLLALRAYRDQLRVFLSTQEDV